MNELEVKTSGALIHVYCGHCKKFLYSKEGRGVTGNSHGVCRKCMMTQMLKYRIYRQRFNFIRFSVVVILLSICAGLMRGTSTIPYPKSSFATMSSPSRTAVGGQL